MDTVDETKLPSGLHLGAGVVLNEKYELLSKLGKGGLARVWRAKHIIGDHDVALKFFQMRDFEEGLSEFKLLKNLGHPSVVRVWDIGCVNKSSHQPVKDKAQHFVSMELIQGKTFQQLRDGEHVFSADQVLEWMKQLVGAVQYIHSERIRHKDIKPGNLMVDLDRYDSRAVLIDFNISAIRHPGAGTLAYKYPGVGNGEGWSNFADVWALAVSFYELITQTKLYNVTPDLDLPLNHPIMTGIPKSVMDSLKTIISGNQGIKEISGYQELFGLHAVRVNEVELDEALLENFGVTSLNEKSMLRQMLQTNDLSKSRSRNQLARDLLKSINRPGSAQAVKRLAGCVVSLKSKGVVEYRGTAKPKRIALTSAFIEAYITHKDSA